MQYQVKVVQRAPTTSDLQGFHIDGWEVFAIVPSHNGKDYHVCLRK